MEKIEAEEGKGITFSEVLLLSDGEKEVKIGSPFVLKAAVEAKVLRHGKGEKKIIFKYKPKKRYRRKIGHRQKFTEIEIISIKS